MAQAFNLTAQLQLQSPRNVNQVVNDIRRQLKPLGVQVKIENTRNLARANKDLAAFSRNARNSNKNMSELNRTLQESARRFSVITIATGSFLALANAFKKSVKEAVAFERELVRISQVTGKSVSQLKGLSQEVTRLSTTLGASSSDLLNVARTLTQAGFAATETRKALDILAKTSLGATFDNIQDTTEGAIALLRQFGDEAKRSGGDIKFLESSLDAINSVSKRFAVESGDLITAIRRTGGVFSAAGGSINELIALFTSVRATTRESAETIATGLRTIFTRIQRPETISQLREFGIELQDAQGNFIGAFKAFEALSKGLGSIDARSSAFSQIVEDLGGFRQVGKVIPLINQFATAQQALSVAQGASGSVAKDAQIAQQSLGVQVQKVREQFDALIRRFTDSSAFRSLATGGLELAQAFIRIADSLEPLLPLLVTLAGLKLGSSIAPALAGIAGIGRRVSGTGPVTKFARGGMVPGSGNRDTVPAMLTPGEFVIRKSSVNKLGAGTLAAMNENRFQVGGAALRETFARGRSKLSNKQLQSEFGTIQRISDEAGKELDAAAGTYGAAFLRPVARGERLQGYVDRSQIIASVRNDPDFKKILSVAKNTSKGSLGGQYISRLESEIQQIADESQDKSAGFAVRAGSLTTKKSTDLEDILLGGVEQTVLKGSRSITETLTNRIATTNVGDVASILKSANIDNVVGNLFEATLTSLAKKNPVGDRDASADWDYITGLGSGLAGYFGLDDISGEPTDAKSTYNSGNVKSLIKKVKNLQTKKSIEKIARNLDGDFKLILSKMTGSIKQENDLLAGRPGGGVTQGKRAEAADVLISGLQGVSRKQRLTGLNSGGGIAGSDTVPALLTPGEFVFNKGAAQSIGYGNLNRMNKQGVQGFAKGGVVSTGMPAGGRVSSGRGFYGNSIGPNTFAADLIAEAEAAADKIEDLGDSSDKSSGKIDKSSKRLAAVNKLAEKRVQNFNEGLEKARGIASAAQSFIFVGSIAGSLANQFSGLSDTTKQAINETAGFVTAVVGIGGTLLDLGLGFTQSIATNSLLQSAYVRSIAAIDAEAAARLKNLPGKGGVGGLGGGKVASVAGPLAAVAAAALVAIAALKFFSARSKAIADEAAKAIKNGLEGIGEGRDVDRSKLVSSLRTEAEERTRSAKLFNVETGLAVGGIVASSALLGATIGSSVPVLGTAIGAVAGAAIGFGAAMLGAENAVTAEQVARERSIRIFDDQVKVFQKLAATSNEVRSKLAEISKLRGLSQERQVELQSSELEKLLKGSLDRSALSARAEQRSVAFKAGVSVDAFANLSEDEVIEKFDAIGLSAGEAALYFQRFQAASAVAEQAQKDLSFAVDQTIKTFDQSLQLADPSKSFDEIIKGSSATAKAFNLAKEAARQKAIFDREAAAETLANAMATGSSAEVIENAQKRYDTAAAAADNAGQLFEESARNSFKIRQAEFEAQKRSAAAADALRKALSEAAQAAVLFEKQIKGFQDVQASLENLQRVSEGGIASATSRGVSQTEITSAFDIGQFQQEASDLIGTVVDPTAIKTAEKARDNIVKSAQAVSVLSGLAGQERISGTAGIQEALKQDLKFLDFLPVEIRRSVIEGLEGASQKQGGITGSDLDEILAPVKEFGEAGGQVFENIAKRNEAYLSAYSVYLDIVQKQYDKELNFRKNLVKTQERSIDLELKARNVIAKNLGKDPAVKDQLGARRRRAAAAQANLNAAGVGVAAGDVGGLSAARKSLTSQVEQLTKDIEAASDPQRAANLQKQQQDAQNALRAVNTELERLADSSDDLNGVFAQMDENSRLIEREKAARQAVLGVLEKFVVGGEDVRNNLAQAAQGIRFAFGTGTLQNQTPEQRQATVGLLDQLADVNIAGAFRSAVSGEIKEGTGANIKQELVIRDAIRMGLDPQIAQQLATATTTEQKLIDANINLATEISKLTAKIQAAQGALGPVNAPPVVPQFASGGVVQYRAKGGSIFKPKGTDTIPAMLSAGEFVVRKSAVDKVGVGALEAINNGSGAVYRSNGSKRPESLSGFGEMGSGFGEADAFFDTFKNFKKRQELENLVKNTIRGSKARQEAERELAEFNDPSLIAKRLKAQEDSKQFVGKPIEQTDFRQKRIAAGLARKEAADAEREERIAKAKAARESKGVPKEFMGPLLPGEIRQDQTRDNARTRGRRRIAQQRKDPKRIDAIRRERGMRSRGRTTGGQRPGIGGGLINFMSGFGGGFGSGFGGGVPFGFIPGSPYNDLLYRGGYSPFFQTRGYFNSGGSVGGDTIPAMLTPGEFVMSAGAVKKHGVGFMNKLNKGNVQGFNKGGSVGGVQYRQEGGLLGAAGAMLGFDTSEIQGVFDGFVSNFSSVLDNIVAPFNNVVQNLNQLSQAFGNLTMQHTVNVEGLISVGGLNIESIKNELSQSIGEMVAGEVQRVMNDQQKNFKSN